jgi:D-alanyl-D-alanine-carboxypeptidase/D-alanyl-D-alanine-endopeptidase
MRRLGVLALLTISASAWSAAPPTTPDDAALRALLVERVDTFKWATGAVIGVTDLSGHRIVAYGTRSGTDKAAADANTVFEIASLTKIFTALLLADAANRQEVASNDPVVRCLPKTAKLPERSGRQITFADLATHTSGLPLRPTNLASQEALDKYAGYTMEQMYAALGTFELDRDPGTKFEYSNWGFGLLGRALALCAKAPYDDLLRDRVLAPLRMRDTAFDLNASMRTRLAHGHDGNLKPVPNEGRGALDPAGSLYSTTNDILRFLDAMLGRGSHPVASLREVMLATHRPTDAPNVEIALGWRIQRSQHGPVMWSAGRADGYRAYMGFNLKTGVGVVAFANAQTNAGMDDIGLHVLDASNATMKVHERIPLSDAVLDRYVGQYKFDDGVIAKITRDRNSLITEFSGQGPVTVYPSAEREFWMDELQARFVFDPAVNDRAPAFTLYQDGVTYRAPRIEEKQK